MNATTTDTSLAGHLIQRRYILTEVDKSQPRWVFHFQMPQHLLDKEAEWHLRHGLSHSREIANALSGALNGRPVKESVLSRWPCVGAAIEG